MRIKIYCQDEWVGWLEHNSDNNLFAFSYTKNWNVQSHAYPLSPHLPLDRGSEDNRRMASGRRAWIGLDRHP